MVDKNSVSFIRFMKSLRTNCFFFLPVETPTSQEALEPYLPGDPSDGVLVLKAFITTFFLAWKTEGEKFRLE